MRQSRLLRLGISACLLGERVRWDGRHKHAAFVTEGLGPVEWVPVCPEVELGLGVPREPIRLEGDARNPRLIGVGSRRDHTEAMTRLARARVAALARLGLSGYVLKSDSPSCGLARVAVHARRRARRGRGLFARALTDRLPALPVDEERALRSAARRARFLEQVRAYARWQETVLARPSRRRLLAFHTEHEPLLRARDPRACRRLGALAASRRPLRELIREYGAAFMQALRARRAPPTAATGRPAAPRRARPRPPRSPRAR